MKFIVIYLDVISSNCTILSSHHHHKDAINSMNQFVDQNKEFDNPSSYKKYYDNTNIISIYKANYIMSKTLIGRYFIKTFEEPTYKQTTNLQTNSEGNTQ